MKARSGESRTERLNANAKPPYVALKRLRERNEVRLRARIIGGSFAGEKTRHRRHVDNIARLAFEPLGLHGNERRAAQAHRSEAVRENHFCLNVKKDVGKFLIAPETGVINHICQGRNRFDTTFNALDVGKN